MKLKLGVVVLCATLATGAQAEHYLSIGSSEYEANNQEFDGLNVVYSGVGRGGFGWIIQPQWVESDENGVEQKLLNASIGVLINPMRDDIVRFYPLVGIAYYKYSNDRESYSKIWPSAGAGVHIQIPSTNFFLDTSYKRVFPTGSQSKIDAISLGAGYRW